MSGEVEPKPVWVTYRNWRGEVAARHLVPLRVWYGTSQWHPEPQWFLDATDVERNEERSFALKDFLAFDLEFLRGKSTVDSSQ